MVGWTDRQTNSIFTAIYYRSFYTQTLLHKAIFTHRSFYRGKPSHRHFYAKQLLHTEVFTQGSLYTEQLLHKSVFTHRSFYTAGKPLHRADFTHRSIYTEAFTHRIHRNFSSDQLLHGTFYTWTLLHRAALDTKVFTQGRPHTEQFLHK